MKNITNTLQSIDRISTKDLSMSLSYKKQNEIHIHFLDSQKYSSYYNGMHRINYTYRTAQKYLDIL